MRVYWQLFSMLWLAFFLASCSSGGDSSPSGGPSPGGTLTANAGGDQTLSAGPTVTLDGSASSGNITTYTWTQSGGTPIVTLTSSDTNPLATFDSSSITSATSLTFTLTVSDGTSQDSDSVTINISPVINPSSGPYIPITTAGSVQGMVDLYVIDNSDPAAGLSLVDSNVDKYTQVLGLVPVYDPVNTSMIIGYKDSHPAYSIYAKNNKIWRVDLAAGSDHIPQQVTSGSYTFCGDITTYNIQANPADSYIFFEAVAQGATCNITTPNPLLAAHVKDNSSTAAIDTTNILYPHKFDEFDGGFLTVSGNGLALVSLDLTTSTPVTLTDSTNGMAFQIADVTTVQLSGETQNGFKLAEIDHQVYSLDVSQLTSSQTISVSQALWDATTFSAQSTVCDTNSCFFYALESDQSYQLYKFSLDGSIAASALINANFTFQPDNLQLSNYYIYLRNYDRASGNFTLINFPKKPQDTDIPYEIETGRALFPFIAVTPTGVFYDFQSLDALGQVTGIHAVYYDDQQQLAQGMGVKSTLDNALLVGLEYGAQVLVSGSVQTSGKFFVASSPTDINAGLAGATIQAYSMADGSALADIGVIPAGATISSLLIQGSGYFGANRFYAGAKATADATTSDIFLLDNSSNTISISNLSNTPAINEYLRLVY